MNSIYNTKTFHICKVLENQDSSQRHKFGQNSIAPQIFLAGTPMKTTLDQRYDQAFYLRQNNTNSWTIAVPAKTFWGRNNFSKILCEDYPNFFPLHLFFSFKLSRDANLYLLIQ